MPFKKGQSGNPAGRKKGVKNKTPEEVRQAILKVFDPIAFAEWVKENPGDYYKFILTKCLPKDIKADVDGVLKIVYSGWDNARGDSST